MRQGQKTSGQVEYQYEVAGIRVASNTHFLLPQAATQEGRASDIVFTLKLPGVQTEERFAHRTPIGRIRNGAGRATITVYEIADGFLLDCNNANQKVEFVITCGGSCIACYPQVDTLVEDIQTWLFALRDGFNMDLPISFFSGTVNKINCPKRDFRFTELQFQGFKRVAMLPP